MKRPINKFILKTLLFIIPVFVFFEVLFRLGFYPVITNSTFFDVKMLTVQKQHVKNVKLLAIGSSVALYELDSKIITHNFNMPYYNFASWGLQITDTRVLLNSFVKSYHPKYVVLCSSFGDFIAPQNDTYLNYTSASDLIKDKFPELFYFKNYNSIYRVIRRKIQEYPPEADNWGGALLRVKKKGLNNDKLNKHDIFPTKYTPSNYAALVSLSASLKAQNVKLIFVEVPVKASYANTDRAKQILQAHFNKCEAIVERHGGLYLNYYNTTFFTDSLFLDQVHLQAAGAMILTREIVGDLKKVIH